MTEKQFRNLRVAMVKEFRYLSTPASIPVNGERGICANMEWKFLQSELFFVRAELERVFRAVRPGKNPVNPLGDYYKVRWLWRGKAGEQRRALCKECAEWLHKNIK